MTEHATPEPASTAPITRAAFARFKVMAFVTGGFLLLLCVEMLLKYVIQASWVDSALGWVPFVHGWIYVVYAVTCLQLWSQARWSFSRLAIMVAGGGAGAVLHRGGARGAVAAGGGRRAHRGRQGGPPGLTRLSLTA